MKKIIVTALFYKPEIWQNIRAGVYTEEDCEDMKYFYHLDIFLDLENIESAIPNDELWLNSREYTDIIMKTGKTILIKLSVKNLARITEHIDANKLICKLSN